MTRIEQQQRVVLKEVPGQINDSEILDFLYNKEINWKHLDTIKYLTDFSDDTVSDWLNLSVRTFRDYRKPGSTLKENVKEHVLVLLALIKHSKRVFNTPKAFDNWLDSPNFYFDNKKPAAFLNTVTGIKFVDDRLTAMEFGDNV